MRIVLFIASLAGFHMQDKRNSFNSLTASSAPPLPMLSHSFYWAFAPELQLY